MKNKIIFVLKLILISLLFSLIIEKFVYSMEPFFLNRFIVNFVVIICLMMLVDFVNKKNGDLIIIKKFKNMTINKIFIFLASIIGITFSVCFPLTQIPDEITHINMIYEERNLDIKFSDINNDYSGFDDISKNENNIVQKSKYFNLSKKIDIGIKLTIPKISIIRHFPQYIGMLIGELLHLPVFFYLTLCELFALAFYIFVCNIALKKMPFKKSLMMFIMLLPVCSQQMSSFSYDVVLNSVCFLFIAYIMDLKFKKDKILIKDILILLLCLSIIFICKMPYVLLALLVFVLPFSKFEFKTKKINITYDNIKKVLKKYKIICFIVSLIFLAVSGIIAYKVLLKMSIGRILIASLLNFKDTLLLFKRSISIFLPYYLETIVGNLGIFNVNTSSIFEFFVYISLFIITFFNYKIVKNKILIENIKFSKRDNLIIYCIVILFIYIIILSMFEWTMYCTKIPNYHNLTVSQLGDYIRKLPYIGGVQGRYFIPIIPLILIPLNSSKITEKLLKLNPFIYQIVYYFIFYIYLTIVLLNRYWF